MPAVKKSAVTKNRTPAPMSQMRPLASRWPWCIHVQRPSVHVNSRGIAYSSHGRLYPITSKVIEPVEPTTGAILIVSPNDPVTTGLDGVMAVLLTVRLAAVRLADVWVPTVTVNATGCVPTGLRATTCRATKPFGLLQV